MLPFYLFNALTFFGKHIRSQTQGPIHLSRCESLTCSRIYNLNILDLVLIHHQNNVLKTTHSISLIFKTMISLSLQIEQCSMYFSNFGLASHFTISRTYFSVDLLISLSHLFFPTLFLVTFSASFSVISCFFLNSDQNIFLDSTSLMSSVGASYHLITLVLLFLWEVNYIKPT